MEESKEVIVETVTPQEEITPQVEAPQKDFEQMFKDQQIRAKKAEDEARELREKLENTNNEVPFTDDGIKTELAEIKSKLAKSEVLEAYPVLKEAWSEFESFRTEEDNRGMNLRTAAKAFLVEKGLLEPKRKGLEKTTGGTKLPQASGMTAEEVKHLRETNFKKYSDMIQKGLITFQ